MLKIEVQQKEEDITLKDHQDKQYEAVINFMSYCEQTLRAEPPWLKIKEAWYQTWETRKKELFWLHPPAKPVEFHNKQGQPPSGHE